MPQFDTVIKGGMIVDGTLVPPYHADLGIKDGKIAKIGKINTNDGAKILDASGRYCQVMGGLSIDSPM